MRYVFLLGGFTGFALAGIASQVAGHGADRVFLDAAVGCLCGAVLFRWFWTIVVRGFRETVIQRHAAAVAAVAASPEPTVAPPPVPPRAR